MVDDKIKDERIKNRLQRPEIKSAIIAPIEVKDELFGVMNIGTSQPSDRFSSENVGVLGQLVKLVGIALQDLSVASDSSP